MAGEPVFPAKALLVFPDVSPEEPGVNGPVLAILFWEEEARWPAIGVPVLGEDVQGGIGKDGVTVGTVLAVGDVDAYVGTADVAITQGADLADAQAGGIHERDHGLLLEVWDGGDEMPDSLLGRDEGEVFVKTAHGELCGIPGASG